MTRDLNRPEKPKATFAAPKTASAAKANATLANGAMAKDPYLRLDVIDVSTVPMLLSMFVMSS